MNNTSQTILAHTCRRFTLRTWDKARQGKHVSSSSLAWKNIERPLPMHVYSERVSGPKRQGHYAAFMSDICEALVIEI